MFSAVATRTPPIKRPVWEAMDDEDDEAYRLEEEMVVRVQCEERECVRISERKREREREYC